MERIRSHFEQFQNDPRIFSLPELVAAEEAMRREPVLLRIKERPLSPAQWREFGAQRWLASRLFEDLLETGIESARRDGAYALAAELSVNLADELGIPRQRLRLDAAGIPILDPSLVEPPEAHAEWRRTTYAAIGLTDEQLAHSQSTPGTQVYDAALEGAIGRGDCLEIAGLILALEQTIPAEFSVVVKGLARDFPSEFKNELTDTPEERVRKRANLRYFVDHIGHDGKSHAPDLGHVLDKLVVTDADRTRLSTGIRALREAKQTFYRSLAERLE